MSNPTRTLVIGTTIHGHDSAAYIIDLEEKRMFAMPTERLTRYKHDASFAIPPIERCITYWKLDPRTVTRVVCALSFTDFEKEHFAQEHYEVELAFRSHFGAQYKKDVDAARAAFARRSPMRKVLELCTTTAGRFILWSKALSRLGIRPHLPLDAVVRAHLSRLFPRAALETAYFEHEYCHVVSTYVEAPFDDAVHVSFDGWGDGHFSFVYRGTRAGLTRLAASPGKPMQELYNMGSKTAPRLMYPSVGGVYSYVTEMLGFTPISDEGKVEALAAYAQPDSELRARFLDFCVLDQDNATLTLDPDKARTILNPEQFQKRIDALGKEVVAASVQAFLEDVSREYVTALLRKAGTSALCLSGGVSANVINNLMLFEHLTKDIYVAPAMADDGAAEGAAYAYLLRAGYTRADLVALRPEMPYLGTAYTRDEVRAVLTQYPALQVTDLGDQWPESVGELISDGRIGAIFHGRMEWGPRALGNRSIVANPTQKDFRDRINLHIKRRPAFQPFCPSILAEERERLFEHSYLNKHMTCAFRLKKEYWEQLPSAIHVDGTARAQFVEAHDNPMYYRMLTRVKERTGFGVVINTSFNKHGRTIVESPHDAIRDFLDTDLDYVVIEGYLVTRRA